MNTYLIIANILVLLTFVVHTFGGDIEYQDLEPKEKEVSLRVKWMMGRGAFHIVSADFLLATVGLTMINFTDYFDQPKLILQILSLYFLLYGAGFFIALVISRKIKNGYLKLWQWILMLTIALFIFLGS